MRNGMTLMSVMVAVALAGIVALAVARLLGNQAKSMSVIRLREQREELLKHYKNILISGWDRTERGGCGGVICSRTTNTSNTNIVIPTANGGALYLSDNLYDYNYIGGTSDKWWKVTATRQGTASGDILQADSYVDSEALVAMKIRVEFMRKEHPVIKTKLAPREEIVFLHHNTSSATSQNNCIDTHLTKRDGSGNLLYPGTGAMIQYDFNSNYTKCSQVPLVNAKDCGLGAAVGFFSTSECTSGTQKDCHCALCRDTTARNCTPPPTATPTPSPILSGDSKQVTGDLICSTDHTSPRACIRDRKEKRTVDAINCENRGYLEWIDDDEATKCVGVDGVYPAVKGDQRVAAESKARKESGDYTYSLYYISEPGGKRMPRTLAARSGWPVVTVPAGPALPAVEYKQFDCKVKRFKGIRGFKGTSLSGEVGTMIDAYDGFGTTAGTAGPRGDPGLPGPPGPQGPAGDCFLCCKDKKSYGCDCDTTIRGITCSSGNLKKADCSCSISSYDNKVKNECENNTSPSVAPSPYLYCDANSNNTYDTGETTPTYSESTSCTWRQMIPLVIETVSLLNAIAP